MFYFGLGILSICAVYNASIFFFANLGIVRVVYFSTDVNCIMSMGISKVTLFYIALLLVSFLY